jgi:hypothetical protein
MLTWARGTVSCLRRWRLERLERLVPRNPGDSPMPSSSDDLPGRKAPARGNAAGPRDGRGRSPVPQSTFTPTRESNTC